MQTWAKRGVQAALVTGGMIAAGTGAASATETCPNRPTPPLGASALSPANNLYRQHGKPCFSGDLFPDHSVHSVKEIPPARHSSVSLTARSGEHPITALSGTLQPLLGNEPTVANYALGRHGSLWFPRLAGWIREEPPGHSQQTVHTPAHGHHRSMSWSGSVGDIVADPAAQPRTAASPELLTPTVDPAVFRGFPDADGIVGLWQNALARSAALLATEKVNLVTPDPFEPEETVHTVYTVPTTTVNSLKQTGSAPPPARREDVMPLTVPGEHQLKADEVPSLAAPLKLLPESEPVVKAPLPLGSGVGILNGGTHSVPGVSDITRALEGIPVQQPQPTPAEPKFSRTPWLAPVWVHELDEQVAATPELDLVTQNPFANGPRSSTVPNLEPPAGNQNPLPQPDEPTLPNLRFDPQVLNELETTLPLPDLAGRL